MPPNHGRTQRWSRVDRSAHHLTRVVLRGLAAVLLVTQGLVHLWQWLDGFSAVPVIGPLFLAGAVAAFALALAVLATDHMLVVGAGVLLSLGQIAAFALSSTVGLFGFEAQWTWTGAEGAALWSEVLTVVVLIALARSRRHTVVAAHA